MRVSDGSIPRVDVLHLHHAVTAGEQPPAVRGGRGKTIVDLPSGYGWRSTPNDRWIMNHMIHNLYPEPDRVYVTYTIDFIPDTSPQAKKMKTVDAMDGRRGPEGLPGLRRAEGQRTPREVHVPDAGTRRLPRGVAAAQRVGRRPGLDADRDRGTCTPADCTATCG